MQAGVLVQRLNERVRGEAHTEEFMLQVVSKAQQVVNAASRIVLATTDFPTAAYTQVYWTQPLLPDLVWLLAVRETVYDTERLMNWKELFYRDRRWSRRVGDGFDMFAMVGRDLMILHPGKVDDGTATAVYVKLTAPLTSALTDIDLPDERTMVVVDIAELLLLLRERRLESFTPLVQRVAREVGVDVRTR